MNQLNYIQPVGLSIHRLRNSWFAVLEAGINSYQMSKCLFAVSTELALFACKVWTLSQFLYFYSASVQHVINFHNLRLGIKILQIWVAGRSWFSKSSDRPADFGVSCSWQVCSIFPPPAASHSRTVHAPLQPPCYQQITSRDVVWYAVVLLPPPHPSYHFSSLQILKSLSRVTSSARTCWPHLLASTQSKVIPRAGFIWDICPVFVTWRIFVWSISVISQ